MAGFIGIAPDTKFQITNIHNTPFLQARKKGDSVNSFKAGFPVYQTNGITTGSVEIECDVATLNTSKSLLLGVIVDDSYMISSENQKIIKIAGVGAIGNKFLVGEAISYGDNVKFDRSTGKYMKHGGSLDTDTIIGIARSIALADGDYIAIEVKF